MLVVARHLNETICIGKPGDVLTEPIIITPVCVKRQNGRNPHIRLGVKAQRNIGVFRSEMLDAVELGQNSQASDGDQHTQSNQSTHTTPTPAPSRLTDAYGCPLCGNAGCEDRGCVKQQPGTTPEDLQAAAGL